MPISHLGAVNVSALSVPQPLVQIVPPQFLFGGVSTNVCGHVGTATWGPVGVPQVFGGYPQFAQIFGPTINRTGDMGSQVILASMQGAGYHAGVRVTDGTDVAATSTVATGAYASGTITFSGNPTANDTFTIGTTTVTFKASGATGNQINIGASQSATIAATLAFLQASADAQLVQCSYALTSANVITVTFKTFGTAGNSFPLAKVATVLAVSGATLSGGVATATGLTLTGKYTGALGNSLKAIISAGTQSGTWKLVASLPGFLPEVYDNIGSGLTGNALWVAIAAAINSGLSGTRGPSNLLVASAGANTNAPISATYTFSSGTDGASSVTTTMLLGQDSVPRTGMYALRGARVSQFAIADLSDTAALGAMVAFGLDIGAYPIWSSPSGDTITNASTTLNTAGVDSFTIKAVFGDWIVWADTINNISQRVSAPAGVILGKLGALSPEQNTLNKPINGIVGTQSSILGKTYSYADWQALAAARMDVITNQSPGGNYFAARLGINTSSNPVIFGDEYPRVTYFLAKSIEVIAGQYIGKTQTPDERRQARVALMEFLSLAQKNGIIGTADGSQAYQVILDGSNNSQATTALGYQYAYVKAIYLGIVRYFVVNLEGGASVTISNTPPV